MFERNGADEIRCSNGSIEYQLSEDQLSEDSIIYYDGTMQEMQDFLSSLGAKEDADSSENDHIICSDGELEFKTLVR